MSVRTAALLSIALLGLSACGHLSEGQRSTAAGAVIGGIAGSVLTGGSTAGTVGGAVVGGVIGDRIEDKKK